MLVSVGMYLPFATTFSIFVGAVSALLATTLRRAKGIMKRNARAAKILVF